RRDVLNRRAGVDGSQAEAPKGDSLEHEPKPEGSPYTAETRGRSNRRTPMKNDGIAIVKNHKIASHEEWLSARKALLAQEKELTRLRDEVSEQRRFLPWEAVTKEYVFEGPEGRESLGQLFDGRSQLVVYHAMFHPAKANARTSWIGDAACKMCSFWIDNFN